MCKGLIGKKLGMLSFFSHNGKCFPVTVVEVGPCSIVQIKKDEIDGYNAIQLGFMEGKISKINKPLLGHFKKAGEHNKVYKVLKEFKIDNIDDYSLGEEISVNIFQVGEVIDVVGITKGRGFSGVIKRHGFKGGSDTHGSTTHRRPGSIGSSAWPSRVIPGKRLPGHYGVDKKTVKNLKILDIRYDENIILLKGCVPGPTMGIIEIKKLKFAK